jgi:RNA-directed DNA polymerase
MMEPQGSSATPHENKCKRRKRSAEEIVSGYQTRIVKAQQAGRFGLVKQLQRMLAHSQSAKAVAVERVTGNKGSKTPGVDGET